MLLFQYVKNGYQETVLLIRLKLREAFKFWYDFANDESSENTIILKVEITEAIVIKDHNAIKYYMDFTKQEENYDNRVL